MPEALKDVYDQLFIERVATEFRKCHPAFNSAEFVARVFDEEWNDRELKARMSHIRVCIHEILNLPYPDAIKVLCEAAPEFRGYEALFFPDYVEAYGFDDWETSIPALEWLTRFSSSELAVRPFILLDQERMMAQMQKWSRDENYHVRRLSSEGCRPRLPWAQALPEFKKDPSPILPILNQLKQDSSDYVRRSVANNLNDIAKDNPEITIEWSKQNSGQHKDTDWIVKHACRTLLKQAHPEVMALFGYNSDENVQVEELLLNTPELKIGETLEFGFELQTAAGELGNIRLEYMIDYLKSNGSYNSKVFKISEGVLNTSSKSVTAKQSFRQMSTRTHYPGEHKLTVRVNGVNKAEASFQLLENV
ncbi:DNA alkylation repair protein [Neptuniibacter sp.]|uniref:DNA alkylation repair protein n=1 Tax=Neptuniibacter sp. TaxID=1962643 RepID=UPI002609EA90|nr:DNA alkylation repair protein [Neptuniibacter sp.]MCP4597885.1 DNA alkylation repair protein [Neptuniibacter sp.]